MAQPLSNGHRSKELPFISVVIPAFNEEKYLPLCLKALKKQTYPKDRFEIIVSDNNSTDKTAAIAKKAGAKVFPEKRQGHVFALNNGMLLAKGEIIACTDADTEVLPNWLELIAKIFEDKEVVAATGSAYYNSHSRVKEYIGKLTYRTFVRLHFAVGKPSLAGPNLAVRKSAFLQIKGLDTRYHTFGDVELGLRIKKIGKVLFVKELTVETSPRRWEKGSIEDYYNYFNSYVKTVWLLRPPHHNLTPRR